MYDCTLASHKSRGCLAVKTWCCRASVLKKTPLSATMSRLHIWHQHRWPQCYKNEHPSVALRSTNVGCAMFSPLSAGAVLTYNLSILCVMVIVPTDSPHRLFINVFLFSFFRAESDDVEERARTCIITGEGRPFILPQRWNNTSLRTRHTDSKRKNASRMLPRKNNPMVFLDWRILRS